VLFPGLDAPDDVRDGAGRDGDDAAVDGRPDPDDDGDPAGPPHPARPPGPEGAPSWAAPLRVFGPALAVLLLVSWRVSAAYTEAVAPSASFAGSWFWDGWVRYDAGWYTMIATQGYSHQPGRQSPVAFFPAYPLAMRGVGAVIGNTVLAGILVTIAAGAGALVAFHRWCAERLSPSTAFAAAACLALYPYAYYLYGAVYGDALFLLAALLAFLAFEHDRMVLAGLAGAVATGTRLVGVAVVVGLVVGVLERRRAVTRGGGWRLRVDLRRLRVGDAGVLLSVGGLVAYAGYLWSRFGDPLLFNTVQEAWGQQSGWRTWFKYDVYLWLRREPDLFYTHGLLVQAVLFLLAVATIPTVARRFGVRYGAYLAVLVAIPAVGSQDFQGMGRYLLGAFPAFAVLGSLVADRPVARRLVLSLSALVLVVFTGMFANGRYIS
jgi:hypothetical protein